MRGHPAPGADGDGNADAARAARGFAAEKRCEREREGEAEGERAVEWKPERGARSYEDASLLVRTCW